MLHLPIQFDDLLKIVDQLSDEQKHILSMRLADEPKLVGKLKKPRVLGLHPGAFQPSADFDDPLSDEGN
jgi:hypothetical protein